MNSRRVVQTTTVTYVLAAAFAAQPTAVWIDDRQGKAVMEREPWVPGGNSVMSAHEAIALSLAPPR